MCMYLGTEYTANVHVDLGTEYTANVHVPRY